MKTEGLDEVIAAIEKLSEDKSPLLIALDGRSGTGKSTLSKQIASKVGAAVIEGDDFYSGGSFEQWDKRSPKEKAALCIDWERMRVEALEPLLTGRTATWHPFNWQTNIGLAEYSITCKPARIVILDGAYSSRPELADLIDLSILVQLPDATRRERLKGREQGSFMEKWHDVWDEAEDFYFKHVRPPSLFDLVIKRSAD